MDNSGALDVFDLVMLKQAYENQYSKNLSLTDYMPELGCTMAEFIEIATDEGYESFINEYSDELFAANISY